MRATRTTTRDGSLGATLGHRLGFVLTRTVWGLLAFLSFNRIRVVRAERLPRGGPVLYVGLHRNGVLDGAAYLRVARRAEFVISAQWHRSLAGRLLFPGIAVARDKDRERGIKADNAGAFREALEHLAPGGQLLILPEGTSSLGPRHLPFQPRAARPPTPCFPRRAPRASPAKSRRAGWRSRSCRSASTTSARGSGRAASRSWSASRCRSRPARECRKTRWKRA